MSGTVVIDGMMFPEAVGRRYRELLDSPAWAAFCKHHAEVQIGLIAAVGKSREVADRLKAEGVSNWNIHTDREFIEARRAEVPWKQALSRLDDYRYRMLKPFMEVAVPFMYVPSGPTADQPVTEGTEGA